MRFRRVLNTYRPRSGTLFAVRNENARHGEGTPGQGTFVIQATEEEALIRSLDSNSPAALSSAEAP